MPAFTIRVKDQEVQETLKKLVARVESPGPVLFSLGQGITERTKRRFETSTGPDGQPWKPNTPEVRKRKGGKPPLIDRGNLMRQIEPTVSDNTLFVTANEAYAAIQNFGGQAGRGHKVTIDPRPFFPIHQDGTLYPQEQSDILREFNDYLIKDL